MPIGKDQIGRLTERVERLQHGRQLAERQQPRNVGHARRNSCQCVAQWLEGFGIEENDRGTGDLAAILEADIDPGDQL